MDLWQDALSVDQDTIHSATKQNLLLYTSKTWARRWYCAFCGQKGCLSDSADVTFISSTGLEDVGLRDTKRRRIEAAEINGTQLSTEEPKHSRISFHQQWGKV